MRILASIALTIFLSSCADYGDKVKRLKGEVFYTSGVTEAEASQLADLLVVHGYFDSITRKSVQFERVDDTCHVRFVIRKEYREERGVEDFMTVVAYEVADQINRGKPTIAHISDDRFKSVYAVPLQRVRQGSGEVLYTQRVQHEVASVLAGFLYDTEFFNDSSEITVQLDRDPSAYHFKMVARDGVENDSTYRSIAAHYMREVSENVIDGSPIDFYFVNPDLSVRRVIYFDKEGSNLP